MNEVQHEVLLLRIPEAAQRLSLGRSTVYELIAAQELPVIRIGRAVRVRASDIADWVEGKRAAAGEGTALSESGAAGGHRPPGTRD